MSGAGHRALEVAGLTKRYGELVALDDVTFDVAAGECVCLVGPNGSGKTTLVECVEGIREPDGGEVRILGVPYAPGVRRPSELGVQLQEESLPARIRVGEAISLFGDLYATGGLPPWVVDLLDIEGLWRQRFATLSGGQKRRVVVALALVGDPKVVILDEPASGLDPVAQERIERLVADLRAEGRAVCLTVHDMDQAARMGDRVVLMRSGRVLADGPPDDLVARLGATHCLEISGSLDFLPAGVAAVEGQARSHVYGDSATVRDLAEGAASAGVEWSIRDVRLLDVYLTVAAGHDLATDERAGT